MYLVHHTKTNISFCYLHICYTYYQYPTNSAGVIIAGLSNPDPKKSLSPVSKTSDPASIAPAKPDGLSHPEFVAPQYPHLSESVLIPSSKAQSKETCPMPQGGLEISY